MDEELSPIVELLTPCIGTSIIGVYEGIDGVVLRMNDGQSITVHFDDECGFSITTEQDKVH